MQNAKRFEMSDGMKEEFSSLSDEDWGELVVFCLKKQPQLFKQKDVIILRLYLTFMGREEAQVPEDAAFLEACGQLIGDLGQ